LDLKQLGPQPLQWAPHNKKMRCEILSVPKLVGMAANELLKPPQKKEEEKEFWR